MSIEVSQEEYNAEVEHRDWLLYRIRLDINNEKHWQEMIKYNTTWANRLKRYYKDLYEKYAKPELERCEERLKYWQQQHKQHFQEAKREHERIKRKRIVEKVKIVEVTAYLNYIPKSLGGKGKTNEYKVIRWVCDGEEDSAETEDDTYELWGRVYYWFREMIDALKRLPDGSLQYGITNRVDYVTPTAVHSIKDWLHCLIINRNTRRVAFEGTANITQLMQLTEDEIYAGKGYYLVRPHNDIHYHNVPSPYIGEKPP